MAANQKIVMDKITQENYFTILQNYWTKSHAICCKMI